MTSIDPITLGIYWNKLITIIDEATATLARTAFSQPVTEGYDFACALFDTRGDMVVQSRHTVPSFVGALSLAVRHFLREYPPERLQPGDTLLMNDPWLGHSQINDYTFVTPIFHRGRVVAYAANVSHSPDVGGRLLSADSREVYEEGVRIPILKGWRRGKPNEDLFRLIRLNVRVPDIVMGDLLAQLAANTIAARRLTEFLRERRLDEFQPIADQILARSEEEMRRAIGRLPKGDFYGEVDTDGFDEPLQLRLKLTIGDDSVAADYAGTSPQHELGLNCAYNYAFAETVFPLICVARPSAPPNGGTLRAIEVRAPEGSVLNPRPPAALGGRFFVSAFLQAVVLRALSQAVPDRVVADCGSPPAVCIHTGLRGDGRRYVGMLLLNGGFGARPDHDGPGAMGWPANTCGTAVERTELEEPFFILRRELVEDSGGAGRYRGGLGHYFVCRSEARGPLTFAARFDRVDHPPLGMFGGRPGGAFVGLLNGMRMHSKKTVLVQPGDLVHMQSAGGAGYGDPRAREPERVLDDVLNGYVSAESARSEYGVAIDLTRRAVDVEETARLRGAVPVGGG